jgi:Flp pilus assembly protein TadD
VLAQSGRYDEAREAFERALKIDPTDPRAKANLDELKQMAPQRTP